MENSRKSVSLLSIYTVFFQIGLMSFGGGLVSWIHRDIVTVRGWMTDQEFLSGVALSQVLPGVNSTNTSIFVGQHLRGPIGASVALVAMLTGPFIAVLLVAFGYKWLSGLPGFAPAIEGVAAVALGMLARLGIQAGRSAMRGVVPVLVMLCTFLAVGVLHWPMLAVVAVLAPLSVILSWPRARGDA
jgi:chromate transporter